MDAVTTRPRGHHRWDAAGIEALTLAESRLYLVEGYLREVGYGGHAHWFGTIHGLYPGETADALEAIGLGECAAVCRRSLAAWPDGGPPADFHQGTIYDLLDEGDPDGVLERLDALDDELGKLSYDDVELSYRHIVENPTDFGIAPTKVPSIEAVLAEYRRVRAKDEAELDKEFAASHESEEVEEPYPEADTFPMRMEYWMPLVALGTVGIVAAIALLANGVRFWPGVLLGVSGCLLVAGLRNWRRSVRMDPSGVSIDGADPIPWPSITGCRLNEFGLTRV